MKVGDMVKLTRYPWEVGRVDSVRPDGTCVVVDPWGGTPTQDQYFQFDPSRIDAWESATEQEVFDAQSLMYDDQWWRCRWCCSCARLARELDDSHEKNCPVGEVVRLRRRMAQREQDLCREIADYLAEQGYPWTANEIRNGSWRK